MTSAGDNFAYGALFACVTFVTGLFLLAFGAGAFQVVRSCVRPPRAAKDAPRASLPSVEWLDAVVVAHPDGARVIGTADRDGNALERAAGPRGGAPRA